MGENNRLVFNYLDAYSNDTLLSMNNSDRLSFLSALKQYYLEYRNTLNIGNDALFATEIEFEDANRKNIEQELIKRFPDERWIVKDDGSLFNGGEINSPPFNDNKEAWDELKMVCDIVSNNAKILENTSGHVHVCMNIFGNNPKYWRNFALLWMTYENIITRFLYGEFTSPRADMEKYASPIALDLIRKLDKLEDRSKMSCAYYIVKLLNSENEKRRSINFKHADSTELYNYDREVNKNTIEFRSGNGTFNPIIWQNYINLLVKLLQYAKSDNFNEQIILNRLETIKNKMQLDNPFYKINIKQYSYIYQDQALELADLIFNNNLDKIYFLRQYYKDGSIGTKPLKRVRITV